MIEFTPGQEAGILATIYGGPFPDESLVSIQTPSGTIAGFVKKFDIDERGEGEGYVRAVVRDVESECVTILLAGSYFTTAGIATLPTGWAAENLAPVEN